MAKKSYSERNLKFETLQLHVGQEQPDPVTDARAVPPSRTLEASIKEPMMALSRPSVPVR